MTLPKHAPVFLALLAAAAAQPALAQSSDDWTGGYVGGFVGQVMDPDDGSDRFLFDTDLDGRFGDSRLGGRFGRCQGFLPVFDHLAGSNGLQPCLACGDGDFQQFVEFVDTTLPVEVDFGPMPGSDAVGDFGRQHGERMSEVKVRFPGQANRFIAGHQCQACGCFGRFLGIAAVGVLPFEYVRVAPPELADGVIGAAPIDQRFWCLREGTGHAGGGDGQNQARGCPA